MFDYAPLNPNNGQNINGRNNNPNTYPIDLPYILANLFATTILRTRAANILAYGISRSNTVKSSIVSFSDRVFVALILLTYQSTSNTLTLLTYPCSSYSSMIEYFLPLSKSSISVYPFGSIISI